jgi:hypothetical protein
VSCGGTNERSRVRVRRFARRSGCGREVKVEQRTGGRHDHTVTSERRTPNTFRSAARDHPSREACGWRASSFQQSQINLPRGSERSSSISADDYDYDREIRGGEYPSQ